MPICAAAERMLLPTFFDVSREPVSSRLLEGRIAFVSVSPGYTAPGDARGTAAHPAPAPDCQLAAEISFH